MGSDEGLDVGAMMCYLVCKEDGEIVKKTADGFESTGLYVVIPKDGVDWASVTVGEAYAAEADA